MNEQQLITDTFHTDGAACVRQAFDSDWIALLQEGIERNIAHPSPFFRELGGANGGFLSDIWSRRYIPEFERFCMESSVATLASEALQTDRVRLAQDTWFTKQAGSSERTPWHHDTVISGPFCSIWIALDPTPRDATLEFVRGSHLWGKTLMPKAFFQDPAHRAEVDRFYTDFHGDKSRADAVEFGEVPDIEADRGAYDIIGWDMEAGDCVVFDARTLHGAPGNCCSHSIRRFVTRWVTDESFVAGHGQDMIDALTKAGLDTELRVGQPIRGELFPEMHIPNHPD